MILKSKPSQISVTQKRLDEEMYQILPIIEFYLQKINNAAHLKQYGVWLSKLFDMGDQNKILRNQYLIELANQIQDGVLQEPFTDLPPRQLLPLMKNPYVPHGDEVRQSWSYTPNASTNNMANRPSRTKRPALMPKKSSIENWKYAKSRATDSSWLDLGEETASTATTSSICAGGDKNKKSQKPLMKTESQANNMKMMRELESLNIRNYYTKQYKNELGTETETQTNAAKLFSPDYQEMERLKYTLQDFTEVKNVLLNTHIQTSNWKRSLDYLQVKLRESQMENKELKSIIDSMKNEINMLNIAKVKEINELEEKLGSYYKQEMQKTKLSCTGKLKSKDSLTQKKFEQIKLKLETQIGEYLKQIKKMDDENRAKLKEKDEQIKNLNKIIDEQKKRLEVNKSKLKGSTQSEDNHLKEIQKLQNELKMKEKVLELKMHAQKSEIYTKIASDRQNRFDQVLSDLEGKYKRLLEVQESEISAKMIKKDQIINDLKHLLSKHEISY